MYKYKQTTDVGDLVLWTNPSSASRIANKPYLVISTDSTLVGIKDENNTTSHYGSVSRKTLFTKPASEAVVGDYMYRITSGSGTFPQHSVIKITRISNNRLGYSEELGVDFDEVIVIAQVKYPLFMQWGYHKNTLVKFDGLNSGTQLTTSKDYGPGEYSLTWIPHTNHNWKPCDFTIEPEIFDIDWWQQRFEAGLPVYISDEYGNITNCNLMPSKTWSKHYTFSMTDPSVTQKTPLSKEDIDLFKYVNAWKQVPLGAATNCSLPQPTIKEQPMKLQQLLDAIFGVSDYEAKPKFIVTVFNNDKEVGTTTAESIEEIQQTIQSDTRLWGCKLVAYKIHSELQTQVPVAITKFKKESNASAE